MQIFGDVANRLNSFGLAYLHIIDRKVVVQSYLPNHFTGGSLIAPLNRISIITLAYGNNYV